MINTIFSLFRFKLLVVKREERKNIKKFFFQIKTKSLVGFFNFIWKLLSVFHYDQFNQKSYFKD